MRKAAVVLAVLVVALLPQVGQAADLQAGWYVKLGLVMFYGTIPTPPYEAWVGWDPSITPGAYGPFEVATDATPYAPYPVVVSVPTTQTGVPAGIGVTIHGQPATQFAWTATGLYVPYETNYDPSEMRIELYLHHSSGQDELIWQQMAGHRTGNVNVLDASGRTISADDSIYFGVVAVPEPPQLMALLLPTLGILGIWHHSIKEIRT
jgi:hypothetical protein